MALHTLICAVCGRRFEASRSDAATCSDRCRQRLSRDRRDAREARLLAAAAVAVAAIAEPEE